MIVQEVANMWSGLDVLLLAVGITSAEMGSLTAGLGRQAIKYLIGHKAYDEYKLKTLCDGCIKFDLKMDDGYYIMIVHCALSLLINYAIHHVYYSAFDDEGQPLAGTSYAIGDYDSDDVDGLNVDNHKKGKDLFISAKGQIL